MASTRYVTTSFWEDSKVQDNATPEDRYFMLYLLTNPHTNQLGCYEITQRTISYETGYTRETVCRLLERMCTILNFIDYDKETNEILITNWHKYNWTTSEKVKNHLLKDIPRIKSKRLLEKIKKNIGYIYGIDTLSKNENTLSVNKIKENKIKENKIKEEVKEENDLYSKIESEFGRTLSPIEYETIAKMVSDYSIESIELALKESVLNKALSLKYMEKILINWKKNNLQTKQEIENYTQNFKKEEIKENRSYYKNLDE